MNENNENNKKDESDDKGADFETAISATGYGLYNYFLLVSAVASAFSHQCNAVIISYLLPAAECDLNLTQFQKGIFNATPFVGMMCSAYLWGFLSDTCGRRLLLVIAYTIDGICNMISSMSQTFWFLLVLKFFTGFIICGPMSIQKSFLAEFHGTQYRSRVMMWTGVFVALANILIPAIAWAIIPLNWSWQLLDGNFTFNSWRMYVAVCSIPSFLAAALIYRFSESPKFLMSCGHNKEALQVLQNVYKWNTGKNPIDYPIKKLKDETLNGSMILTTGIELRKKPMELLKLGQKQTKPLFLSPHRSKAILVFTIQFWTLLGMNTLRLWLPQFFASMEEYNHHQAVMNSNITKASLCEMLSFAKENKNKSAGIAGACSVAMLEDKVYVNAMIIGAAMGLAFLTTCYVINLISKKMLMILLLLIGGASGTAIYWSRDDTTTLILSSMYVALVGVCHTISIAVVVELFPTSLRNMAVSLTLMSGQLGTVLGNVIFPVLLDLNCVVPFFLIGIIILVCAALCLLLPRTKVLV